MPSLIVRSACPPFFVLILSATRPSNCYAAIVAHLPRLSPSPSSLSFASLSAKCLWLFWCGNCNIHFHFSHFPQISFTYFHVIFFTGREYFYLLVRLDKVVVAIVVCFLLFAVIEIHKGHWSCVRARCSMQWGILSVRSPSPSLPFSLWADTWLSAAIFTTFCAVLFHSVHIIAFSLSPPPPPSHRAHTQPPKFAAASHSRGPATPIKRIYSSNGTEAAAATATATAPSACCSCCCCSLLFCGRRLRANLNLCEFLNAH